MNPGGVCPCFRFKSLHRRCGLGGLPVPGTPACKPVKPQLEGSAWVWLSCEQCEPCVEGLPGFCTTHAKLVVSQTERRKWFSQIPVPGSKCGLGRPSEVGGLQWVWQAVSHTWQASDLLFLDAVQVPKGHLQASSRLVPPPDRAWHGAGATYRRSADCGLSEMPAGSAVGPVGVNGGSLPGLLAAQWEGGCGNGPRIPETLGA